MLGKSIEHYEKSQSPRRKLRLSKSITKKINKPSEWLLVATQQDAENANEKCEETSLFLTLFLVFSKRVYD